MLCSGFQFWNGMQNWTVSRATCFFMWTENGIAQTLSAAMGIRENAIQKSAEKRLFGLSGVVGWDGVDVVSVAQPQEPVKHTCCVELRPDNNENAEHCICRCEK